MVEHRLEYGDQRCRAGVGEGVVLGVGRAGEIGARAKGRALTCEHEHSHGVVETRLLERVGQGPHGLRGEHVAGVGARERERRDPANNLIADRHRRTLPSSARPSCCRPRGVPGA